MTQPPDVTTDADPDDTVLPGFEGAWDHLADARRLRTELREVWDEGRSGGFRTDLVYDDAGGFVEVVRDWNAEVLHRADRVVEQFGAAIRGAFDAALAATSATVNAAADPMAMPFTRSPEEYQEWIDTNATGRLRRDHTFLISQFQPFFADGAQGIPGDISRALSQLDAMTDPDRPAGRRLGVWVHDAAPKLRLSDDTIVDCTPEPDGLLRDRRIIGRFGALPAPITATNANVGFAAIFDDDPEPAHFDDVLDLRSRTMVVMACEFVRACQRSVTGGFFDRLPSWLAAPHEDEDAATWHPMPDDCENAEEINRILDGPAEGMARYTDPDGSLSILLRAGGVTFMRSLLAPRPLADDVERGIAAEVASLDAAALWGLPDFVFRAAAHRKGRATREIGDGTILVGRRGVAVQVKARSGDLSNSDRQAKWVQKMARTGANQARGTVRTLRAEPKDLTNGRDRQIVCDGNAFEWVGAVIIDHPDPPEVLCPVDEGAMPVVVLTRRDWDFLFNQLRSVSAVVDYLHRVAAYDPEPLGREPVRYFELAQEDLEAMSGTGPEWATGVEGSFPMSVPVLPTAPASPVDTAGHQLFRIVLEDVAVVDFNGSETDRLELLAMIDRFSVVERANMGRLVLDHLAAVATVPIGTVGWRFRRVMQEGGQLQLAFGAASGDQRFLEDALYRRMVLWHEQLRELTGIDEPDEPCTVGVMLSPRYDGVRPWDTATQMFKGPTFVDPAELTAAREAWAQLDSSS